MADPVKTSGVYTTPEDGTTRSTAGSAGTTAGTGTGAAAGRGDMPKWVWIVGLVVLSLLLWRVLAPSTTGDATAPAGPTSGASDAMPAPAPAPTR